LFQEDTLRRWLPVLGAATPLIILTITVLSLVLTSAQAMNLSVEETSSWILVLYGLSGIISVLMTFYFRQPLLITGNIFIIIFAGTLGDEMSYPEFIGAVMLAGFLVIVVTGLGLTGWLTRWIPAPIVQGLLAGAILHFVSDMFTLMGDEPVMIGGTLLAYFLSRRFIAAKVPPVLPSLVVGVVIAAITGKTGPLPTNIPLPVPVLTTPVFSVQAIASATPVLVVLLTLQSNLPSIIFMKSQGYTPPQRIINFVGGAGTMLGSLLGPIGVSLSLPATSLVAGPSSAARDLRLRVAYLSSAAVIAIGLLAGIAADLPMVIPVSLLLTLAGLSIVDVLTNALQEVTRGPLVLGPFFSFMIALSEISLFGFGPFFWALVMGIGVSMLLEHEQFQMLNAQPAEDDESVSSR
jgi:benzoate membrane transport protein